MFEEFSFESLVERMLDRVSDDFDKREGSVIYDAVAPAAMELANFYDALDMVMDEVFAESASYYYLIKRAAERGIAPKEETHAIGKMIVTPPDVAIAAGDRFNLNSLNYTVTSALNAELGEYRVECETAGTIGNQQLGSLLVIETQNELNNMESAELVEILIPGEEEEDVETFRERYFASFHNQAYGGNKADYIEKVTNIAGVGGCKPYRVWNGDYHPSKMIPSEIVEIWFGKQSEETLGAQVYEWLGTVFHAAKERLLTVGGTVKVDIITSDWRAPTKAMLQIIQEEIDPTGTAGEGDGIAPIGHVVMVEGVKEVSIDISTCMEYKSEFSFSNLQEPVHSIIDDYFLELCEGWAANDNITVRISQIESRLLELDGIIDIRDTKLNGNAENVILDRDSIPVRGEVVV